MQTQNGPVTRRSVRLILLDGDLLSTHPVGLVTSTAGGRNSVPAKPSRPQVGQRSETRRSPSSHRSQRTKITSQGRQATHSADLVAASRLRRRSLVFIACCYYGSLGGSASVQGRVCVSWIG